MTLSIPRSSAKVETWMNFLKNIFRKNHKHMTVTSDSTKYSTFNEPQIKTSYFVSKNQNFVTRKKSICFYNSPNFLDWKHGCVWCVATILFECGNMWRKYPLDSLLDFFCTPTLPFLIQHDMKKVGGEERKEKLFFSALFSTLICQY